MALSHNTFVAVKKSGLAWFAKELRKAQKKSDTKSMIIPGVGGLTLAWGEPVHAWLEAESWEKTAAGAGRIALNSFIDAIREGQMPEWSDQTILGSNLDAITIQDLLNAISAASPKTEDVTLPHSQDKTQAPKLSLERFPICPSGERIVSDETAVADIDWVEQLKASADRTLMVYYYSDAAQAVVILQNQRVLDGLWIEIEEEPLVGTEAMNQLASARTGDCIIMTLSEVCTWALPMMWRIPVRWDTLPLEYIDATRCCRALSTWEGSTLCVIETNEDAWIIGIQDGWVVCVWSEANRLPRVDVEELKHIWTQADGVLTIHRAMEPINDLPVHEGVFKLEEIDVENAETIKPCNLRQLLNEIDQTSDLEPEYTTPEPSFAPDEPVAEMALETDEVLSDTVIDESDTEEMWAPQETPTEPKLSPMTISSDDDYDYADFDDDTTGYDGSVGQEPPAVTRAAYSSEDDKVSEAPRIFPDEELIRLEGVISSVLEAEHCERLVNRLAVRECNYLTANWLCLELRCEGTGASAPVWEPKVREIFAEAL